MIKRTMIPVLFILNSCTTFEREVVDCPKLSSPKNAAEVIVNSENNLPVYLGFRGVELLCFKNDNYISMKASVNVRAIRKNFMLEDYVPVKLSIVSVDSKKKEYDRDDFFYSQFLLKGSKIVDRETDLDLDIPKGGEVFLGVK